MLYKFIDVTFWKTHIIHSIFLSLSPHGILHTFLNLSPSKTLSMSPYRCKCSPIVLYVIQWNQFYCMAFFIRIEMWYDSFCVCVSMVWIWEKRLNILHHTGNCIRKKRRKKRACGHFFLSPQISERDIISVVVVSGVHWSKNCSPYLMRVQNICLYQIWYRIWFSEDTAKKKSKSDIYAMMPMRFMVSQSA